MASLLKQHGNYYVQYYDGNRDPKRKRVSLSTTRKTKARKRERRLTEAYHSGGTIREATIREPSARTTRKTTLSVQRSVGY